jgi:hypothetical protein
MYTVFRGSVPQGNKKFATYEQARQAVRRWIRKNVPAKAPAPANVPLAGIFSWTSNPQIGDFGYSIKKV